MHGQLPQPWHAAECDRLAVDGDGALNRREAANERAAGSRDAAEWRAERGDTCEAALQLLSDRAQASHRVLAVCRGLACVIAHNTPCYQYLF